MPTTYSILASALPALQGPGTARIVGDANTDPGATFGAKQLTSGNQAANTFPRKANQNALLLDYAVRAGSPAYGIIEGLTFTDSTLTLTVATGKATVDGVIELPVATNVTLTNAATNRIWLKRDGTLESITSTTPPAIPACYLGAVIVAGGVVTSYDLSGVMYHVGGLTRRRTGDVAKPTDTPGVTWAFLQQSTSAWFLWTGSAYLELAVAAVRTLFAYIADVSNGTTVETDIFTDTIAANTLLVNKDRIVAKYAGIFAANGNNKRLRVYFAGTVIYDSTALACNGGFWEIDVEIIRTAAATARAVVRCGATSALLPYAPQQTDLSGEDWTTTNILKLTAESGTASTDITGKQGSVEFRPAP